MEGSLIYHSCTAMMDNNSFLDLSTVARELIDTVIHDIWELERLGVE